jgi:ABC-type multidrug transport system ATPase subunit
MKVSLTDAGKRFNRDWIFRHFTYSFEKGQSYAIIGPNGSGKSTLLQVLSGSMHVSEGKIEWATRNGKTADDGVYRLISLCAPYLELVEEMTLGEFLHFHGGFKPFLPGSTINSISSALGLEEASNKQIRNYSSGMKQRVKLAQAIFSDTPVVLLDEPCTNLDIAGIELYRQLIDTYCKDRLVVVSSNDEIEYRFCQHRINVNDYKH